MKKKEFEQALKNAPKESEMYFRFDDGHEMRILNCHREERDIIVLRTSVLWLQMDFMTLGQLFVYSAYYHATSNADIIFRYEGTNYYISSVAIEQNKVILS